MRHPFPLLILGLSFAAAASAAETPYYVDEVDTLVSVESHGYGFSEQMGSPQARDLAALYAGNAGYRAVVDDLARDLAKLALGRSDTGPSMKYSRRTMDSGWLKSKKARFELAGITWRPDRKFLHEGRCGEVRLIYRLAYTDGATAISTRLPMTLQQVRTTRGPCDTAAAAWKIEPAQLVAMLGRTDVYDVELNLQSVRWPAAIRPDMGGYAEYMMRAFEPTGSGWKPKPLLDTIDVAKLRSQPDLRAKLLKQLRSPAMVQAVDRGEGVLDPEFLATKVSSVAVHGLNRDANRLYGQIFTAADFAGLDFGKTRFVKSPGGYLRKLEEQTCVGCHQSKSIAGFHFLGKDRPGGVPFNGVKVPFSYHFIMDQARRADASGIGFADRPPAASGKKNERCYVGDDPSFTDWTCRTGVCEPVGSAVGTAYFGVCQDASVAAAGDACYFGRTTQNLDPHKDREVRPKDKACADALGCLHPSDGYPGGLCFANFCDPKSGKACAALAVPGFNPCLAKGRPFRECLERYTGSIEAAVCDQDTPCRDDFICAEGFAGKGVCAPPYSLFQLRVDGHGRP